MTVITQYWKHSYTDNINIFGGLQLNDHKLSEFSKSNYATTIPENFSNYAANASSWEMQFKMLYVVNPNDWQVFYGDGMTDYVSAFSVESNGAINISIGSPSKFIARQSSTNKLTSNTVYWIKFLFTGSTYEIKVSTDGTNFDTWLSVSSTTKIPARSNAIWRLGVTGTNRYASPMVYGYIDLTETYIKVDNNYIWQGAIDNPRPATKDNYDFTTETVLSKHSIVKYWKYAEDWIDWTRPTLSASNWPDLGGDYFSVKATDFSSDLAAYRAVDGYIGDAKKSWVCATSSLSPYTIYNPKLLKISRLESTGYYDGNWILETYKIAASDDGVDYKDVTESLMAVSGKVDVDLSAYEKGHKYWRIIPLTTSKNSQYGWSMLELYITAKELGTKVIKATSADYDFVTIEKGVNYINSSTVKYWKHDYSLNATIVGSLQIDGTKLSGFSTASYARTIPENFSAYTGNANSWEVQFKIFFVKDKYKVLYASGLSYGSVLGIYDTGAVEFLLNNTGTSSNLVRFTTTKVLQTNTTYWIRFVFTGSAYQILVSTDGKVFENWASVNSTTKFQNRSGANWRLGVSAQSRYEAPFSTGHIDLSETYIKIDNNYLWQGTIDNPVPATSEDYDFTTTSNPLVKLPFKPKVTYWKNIQRSAIPRMTSNTEPEGTVTLLSGALYADRNWWYLLYSDETVASTAQPKTTSYSQRYTFQKTQPIGKYKTEFYYAQDTPKYTNAKYNNRGMYSYQITINYEDGTSAVVANWNGDLGDLRKFEDSFTISKPFTSIDFSWTGRLDTFGYSMGCVYDFYLTQTTGIATPEDYDFTTEEKTYYVL